jgi:hypothetical protein
MSSSAWERPSSLPLSLPLRHSTGVGHGNGLSSSPNSLDPTGHSSERLPLRREAQDEQRCGHDSASDVSRNIRSLALGDSHSVHAIARHNEDEAQGAPHFAGYETGARSAMGRPSCSMKPRCRAKAHTRPTLKVGMGSAKSRCWRRRSPSRVISQGGQIDSRNSAAAAVTATLSMMSITGATSNSSQG